MRLDHRDLTHVNLNNNTCKCIGLIFFFYCNKLQIHIPNSQRHCHIQYTLNEYPSYLENFLTSFRWHSKCFIALLFFDQTARSPFLNTFPQVLHTPLNFTTKSIQSNAGESTECLVEANL